MSGPYLNRELSWIDFNARVLSEAENPDVPLLERLKFLSIVSSNFDEFFMVRVATLMRQMRLGQSGSCPTGMSPREQLDAISARVGDLLDRAYAVLLNEIFPGLAEHGVVRTTAASWSDEQRRFVRTTFRQQVFPVLTPIRATIGEPLPHVGNLRLHAAFLLEPGTAAAEPEDAELLAVVQVPPSLDRVIHLPATAAGTVAFTFLEQVILSEGADLFPGYRVAEQCLFRVTRDADFGVDEERDEDFVEAMEQVIGKRDDSDAIRLSINRGSRRLRTILTDALGLRPEEVYESPDPLELRNLMDVYAIDGFSQLRDEPWKILESRAFDTDEPIWDAIRRRDVLLFHPYESFGPVVRMVEEAATDPSTLAIKMTLYRTSGNSPIIRALETAAANGKQVSVLVELKARFDEEQNIGWAQRLEKAGIIIAYGIARLKVHAKALMVVRREKGGIRRYVHLGTGNYNDKTARLYTDFGLMTADERLCAEVGLFFNAITGYSVIPGLSKLTIAPTALKPRLLELIRRETTRAASAGSGAIIAKMNSLADTDIIDALYEASQAGVQVHLNIRGICMLIPGRTGVSENIRVVSVIDRYLEHARVFYFENGGTPELYLSSADWMPRNLEKRVELMFPVADPDLQRRIRRSVDLFFRDTTKAHEMDEDGRWRRIRPTDAARTVIRAQEETYLQVRELNTVDETENRESFNVRRRAPG